MACNVSDYTCDKHTEARLQNGRGCRVAAALDSVHSLADATLQALWATIRFKSLGVPLSIDQLVIGVHSELWLPCLGVVCSLEPRA